MFSAVHTDKLREGEMAYRPIPAEKGAGNVSRRNVWLTLNQRRNHVDYETARHRKLFIKVCVVGIVNMWNFMLENVLRGSYHK